MTYDIAPTARILADRAGSKSTAHVLRNLRVLVDIERTPTTRETFSLWLSDLASTLEQGVAQLPSREEALSGLLRGMARRVGEYRLAARAEAEIVDQQGTRVVELINDNKRLRLLLARSEDGKPNPWFTPADEFPIEQHEREDRRVESIEEAHAQANMQNRDPMQILRRGEWHTEQIRERKASSFWQHYEAIARMIDGLNMEERKGLLNGPWPETEPVAELDAPTERVQHPHGGVCPANPAEVIP